MRPDADHGFFLRYECYRVPSRKTLEFADAERQRKKGSAVAELKSNRIASFAVTEDDVCSWQVPRRQTTVFGQEGLLPSWTERASSTGGTIRGTRSPVSTSGNSGRYIDRVGVRALMYQGGVVTLALPYTTLRMKLISHVQTASAMANLRVSSRVGSNLQLTCNSFEWGSSTSCRKGW